MLLHQIGAAILGMIIGHDNFCIEILSCCKNALETQVQEILSIIIKNDDREFQNLILDRRFIGDTLSNTTA